MHKYSKPDNLLQFQGTMNREQFYLPLDDNVLSSLMQCGHAQYVKHSFFPQDHKKVFRFKS